jgi:hypothetical protein
MIKAKIAKRGRNYRLDIPVPIIKSMGWGADEVKLHPNPVGNFILIINKKRKPVGFTRFMFLLNHFKWLRNKKKYSLLLNKNKEREFNKLPEKDREYLFSNTTQEANKRDMSELGTEEEILNHRLKELEDIKIYADLEIVEKKKRLREVRSCIKKKTISPASS